MLNKLLDLFTDTVDDEKERLEKIKRESSEDIAKVESEIEQLNNRFNHAEPGSKYHDSLCYQLKAKEIELEDVTDDRNKALWGNNAKLRTLAKKEVKHVEKDS